MVGEGLHAPTIVLVHYWICLSQHGKWWGKAKTWDAGVIWNVNSLYERAKAAEVEEVHAAQDQPFAFENVGAAAQSNKRRRLVRRLSSLT